jgi:hypothetical protein
MKIKQERAEKKLGVQFSLTEPIHLNYQNSHYESI